jgi:hypothetical protein
VTRKLSVSCMFSRRNSGVTVDASAAIAQNRLLLSWNGADPAWSTGWSIGFN